MGLGAAAAFLALGPGAASAQPLTCGQTITKDTTLHADLGPCPGDGLVIGATNVKLDLNGHAITGDATGEDVGVLDDGHGGTVVENGRIRRFDSAIRLEGADRSRVSHVATNPGCCYSSVVEVLDSNYSQIENNFFAVPEGSDFEGQVFEVSGSHNTIENNVARGPEGGFQAAFRVFGPHNTVSGNDSLENGGIVVQGSGNQLTLNDVVGSDFGGFAVYGARNLIARNSVQGPEASTLVSGPGNVIRENHLHGGSAGSAGPSLGVGDCRNVRIEGNTVREGMSAGACQNTRIEDNSLHAGMDIYGGSGNTIRQNTVSGAESGGAEVGNGIGVYGGSGSSIEKNTISDADLSGIFVGEALYGGGGHSVGTTVRGNLVTRSGFDPYADDNDDGIHVDDPGTVIANNRANDNFDYGIQGVPGVIDGGGNTASGNGNPLQCLNVVCN
jgi:hypothetical protein